MATSTQRSVTALPVSRRTALAGLGCAALLGGLSTVLPAWASEESTSTAYDGEVAVTLSDDGVTVDGAAAPQAADGEEAPEATVYTAHDVVYYEDRDTYDSGNLYGEGTADERHSAEDAAAVTVVHITQPGTYRLTGTLSAGQIAVDLGEDAASDPEAVVTLVLDGMDVTCDVAPGVVFYNVYECDGDWSTDTATSEVDTSAAGANVILADGSENRVTGSHVARIYKDNDKQKKKWKIDGAFYSYMSLNVNGEAKGTGTLHIVADNEGLDSELHLTINGGNVSIESGDDGINTNEDGVSVTTVNGGTLHIVAGLGDEGDGIDSNGFLVVNGGTVIAMANPRSDSGLDSDMGSYVNGGVVVALGSTMDWAESDSNQVTMNLQFSGQQDAGDAIVVCDADGNVVFAYDPSEDETAAGNTRTYQGAVLSCPAFTVGETYAVYVGGVVTGDEVQGVYDTASVTDYEGGVQQAYTGTDVQSGPGGFGGPGGGMGPGGFGGPNGQDGGMGPGGQGGPGDGDSAPQGGPDGDQADQTGEPPARPEGEQAGEQPAGAPSGEGDAQGEPPARPEGDASDGQGTSDGEAPAGDTNANAGGPGENAGDVTFGANSSTEASTEFYMQDKVNCFSGVTAAA